ncbi:MAG: TolC family protein [Tatlockia sp.]|nr:TolC family protein [Tatlockia sp.]
MSRLYIKLLLLFILLTFSLGKVSYAETTKPKLLTLSLKEAVFLSLRFNPIVKSSEIQRVVDKFNLAVAKNQFELQYALTGSALHTNSVVAGVPDIVTGSYNLVPAANLQTVYGTKYNLSLSNPVSLSKIGPTSPTNVFYNPALTLAVAQPLIQGSGREVVQAPLNAACNREGIARFAFKSNVIANVTVIMIDYWAVVAAEGALQVAKLALKVSIQTVKNNALQIQQGFLARSENIQALAAVANQRILVASSENQLMQAKLALLRDMGISPFTPIKVDKNLTFEKYKYPKGKQAKRLLFANNPALQIERLNLRNAKINLLLAEDQQRWSLNLVGTIVQGGGFGGGRNGGIGSLFNGSNRSRSLGLTLNVPIDNLPLQQQFVTAKVALTQQQLNARLLKLNLVTQLLSQLENLKILRLQIKLAKESVQLSYQSYQDALKKVTFGQASMFEVTTLQTNFINASLAVIGAEVSYLNAIAAYYQLLGITLNEWAVNLVY